MAQNLVNSSNPRLKKLYFKLIAFLLPFLFLGIVEVVLRLFSYGTNLNLFVEHHSEKFDQYYMVNPYVGKKYFNRLEATSVTNDIFLKQKPENGFRLFVMGSSTLYGFPYDRNLMATRILHKRLQDSYPDKFIEIINTSSTAINSITLKDYINQILDHDPDAILIYAGHNEYYGAFGIGSNETMSKNPFLRSLHFKFVNFRVYQLMQSIISEISKQAGNKSVGDDAKGTLMKRIVKDKDIVYQSANYQVGIEQFRDNLKYILQEAKDDGVPVFLSDLVSNIKDLPPFGNIDTENLSATTEYNNAKNALSKGDTVLAKELFYKAKDLDPVRFRAPEEINRIIHEQATHYGAYLIPAQQWFSNASPQRLIGNNLLTEHVHPNIDGQFVLADAFYTIIIKSNLIDEAPNPYTTQTWGNYRRNWGYTALDSLVGVYKINQLKSYWPFTSLDAAVTFRDTLKISGLVDSLAFTMITKPDADISSLHKYLGEYYENKEQLFLAYKEFDALVRINPYRPDYYNRAANLLLKLDDLHTAENYLKTSIQYQKTYFAHSMLGEIEFIKHNYAGAIDAYKMALELAEKDSIAVEGKLTLLQKLYRIYRLRNDSVNMNDVRHQLSELGFKEEVPIQSHEFEYSNYVPYNIKPTFEKALKHFDSNPDSSLNYLFVCLQINDCPLVNLLIGDLLYQKQDNRLLFFYNKAYNGYSKDPAFLSKLCFANFVNRKNTEGKAILEELIKIKPDHKDVARFKSLFNR